MDEMHLHTGRASRPARQRGMLSAVSAAAMLLPAIFAAAGPAYGQAFSCQVNSANQPTVRYQGRTEQVADLFLECNGLRPSGGLAADAVTVTFNVPVTSRITNTDLNATEALLLLDAPAPENQIGQALGGPVTPGANVLQGELSGPNTIRFNKVLLADSGPVGSVQRSVRITNLRANVASLRQGGVVTATVAVASQSTIAVSAATQNVATVGAPLALTVRTPDDLAPYSQQLSGCGGKPVTVNGETARDFNIRFNESSAAEFRKRNVATSIANPGAVGDQNAITGLFGFGTESGFFNSSFPTTGGMNTAGLATQGTRLMARFTGLPPNAQVWVTTQPVVQGTSTTGITARLTQAEANGSGPYTPIQPQAGTYAQLPVTNGAAAAVWEIFEANQSTPESIAFGVIVSIPANTLGNATIAVAGLYAPQSAAASTIAGVPVPNFDGGSPATTTVYEVKGCAPTLSISQACPMPPATVGLAYSVPLSASGGVLPYAWSIGGGTLPPGIVATQSGLISGTPTQTGIFGFTLKVTDSAGTSATQDCSISVQAGVTITNGCPLPDGAVGVAYSQTFAATGGTAPYVWALARGALPTGIALDRTTGTAAGTPASSGLFNFTVQTTDARGSAGQKDCAIRIIAPLRISQNSISLTTLAGNAKAITQLLHLTSDSPGQAWSVRAATANGGADWLRVAPGAGRAPGIIEVSAVAGNLAEGVYRGTVTVTTQGTSQTAAIPVEFQVRAGLAPYLVVETQSVQVSVPQGAQREDRIVQVANGGPGTVTFNTTLEGDTSGGWVQLAQASADASSATPGRVRLLFLPGALNPGTYRVRLVVDSPSTFQRFTIPVVLGVTASRDALTVTPSVVSLRAVSAAPPPQMPHKTISIAATGAGAVNWQATVLTEPGQIAWLTVNPASGRAVPGSPSTLELRVNSTLLSAQNSSTEILITAPGTDLPPRQVAVNLQTIASGSLLTTAEPSGLGFTGAQGGPITAAQSVTLYNFSRSAVTFDSDLAGDPTVWTVGAPADRTIPPGGSAKIDIAANPGRVSAALTTAQLYVQVAGEPTVKVVDLELLLNSRGNSATAQPAIDAVCAPGGFRVIPLVGEPGFTAPSGSWMAVQALVLDASGAPSTRGAVTANLTGSAVVSTLTPLGDGRWSGMARVGAEGAATLNVWADDRERGLSGCYEAAGTISPTMWPVIADQGVLSSASYSIGAPLAPGSMTSVFGGRLADGFTGSLALPLPTQLGSTRGRIAGTRLPLIYAGRLSEGSQINAILPYGLQPNTVQQLHMQSSAGIAAADVFIAEGQPGVFTASQGGNGQAIAVLGSNPLVLAAGNNPAPRGETIIIYCEGLGATSPAIEAGRAVPATSLYRAILPVRVLIGGQEADVQFAGLTPGFTGLYQINVVVPASVAPGDNVPVVVIAGGQASPPVTISVRQ